ncbi:unnamed protein product [Hydatigera taeniaeformis]|uniref:Uncharacterized protein n=1 Tax=Hydatigena taeniaeformis TaxID=6205 RepID=A0A3P7FPN1_HYDTA|nr:unnamed protein product [Hydatigera taeniaeformis]
MAVMSRRLDGRLLFGCGPCRPKWVKVVDNIYTGNHSVVCHFEVIMRIFKEGIDKLVCHCARKPDKLDNIAKYLHKKLLSDLHHRNYANVNITMEAISALVNTCYRLKLNLFDSSFLKMVLLLLEQDLPELQLLGTKSFLGFSQIEEDAPSYYREYDDLVDHFTRMAYSELPNEVERKKVRMAGIRGLQGVVRKTARGQLRMNALQSMEKIIPALLFNIHERPPSDDEADESEPGCQAVFVFKDVVCRASFTNLIPVVSAMITQVILAPLECLILLYSPHFDNHRLWTPSDFPLLVFGYLLDSIKNMQVAHNLVKELIKYLRKSDTRLTTLQRISVVMSNVRRRIMGAGQSNHKLHRPSLYSIRFNRIKSRRIFSHKTLLDIDGRAPGVVGVGDLASSNPPSSFESESASVSLSHSFTLAGSASSSPTPPIETLLMLLGESNPSLDKRGCKKGKPVLCGDEATDDRHHHPQPRKRAPLGFSIMPAGGVALTVYIKTALQRQDTEDWKIFGKKAERYLTGLERQYNCNIMLFDRQSWFRGVPIRKLRIVGNNCQDVLKCKGGLPAFISENLITSEDNYVIDKSVITLAKGAIGPDVFHNFKALLQILRSSIEKTSKGVGADEQRFHDAIMNTIAEFAKNLPDAQKIEILKFILNFDPLPSGRSNSKDYSKPMVKVLVKTMLTVATQYQTVAISNAIDSDFLRLLLHGVALDPDASIRVYVQKILHALIDRHNNASKLLRVRIYPAEEVTNVYTREKPSRQDILFMKKTGYLLTENIFHQMLDPSNKVDNLEHLMCTIGLVALEMGAEEAGFFRIDSPALATIYLPLLNSYLRPLLQLLSPPVSPPLSSGSRGIVPFSASGSAEGCGIKWGSSLAASMCYPCCACNCGVNYCPHFASKGVSTFARTSCKYPAQLVISKEMLFCRETIQSALHQAALDPSNLDIPYQPFDPLKALQSLRVAMLGSSAAMTAAGGVGTGSVTTPGGRTSGASEYGSTNRFSGWSTLPGSLNRGAGPGNAFRNGVQYGSKNAMPMGADSQSLSSLSMADSSQSVPNVGSRASDLEREEMISFKHAQKILYESPETRRRRKYAENMRLTSNYDALAEKGAMDFNELCALHKERAQTQRFNMVGVFSDLSNELNRRKLSQRRVSLNTGGLSFLRGNARTEKTDGMEMALRRSVVGSGGAAEENSGGEAIEWRVDREGAPVARVTQEAGKEDTPGQGVASSAIQSNWDSNFISLFVS